LFDRLNRLGQPWLFVVLAVPFGVLAYFLSGESLWRGATAGAAFGLAISVWLRVRTRLWRDEG
jgi:hypothetical protein